MKIMLTDEALYDAFNLRALGTVALNIDGVMYKVVDTIDNSHHSNSFPKKYVNEFHIELIQVSEALRIQSKKPGRRLKLGPSHGKPTKGGPQSIKSIRKRLNKNERKMLTIGDAI